MLLMTYWGGMRIGEVAATKVSDVLALDGTIKQELRLKAAQTKGKSSRVVVLSDKLRKELLTYLQIRFNTKQLIAVSYTEA
jgi:integrase/recombinase XerD